MTDAIVLEPPHAPEPDAVERQIAMVDWKGVAETLDARGYAIVNSMISKNDCDDLVATYDKDDRFRNRVVMARHNFGSGEYKYFAYPLPKLIATLRTSLYSHLVGIANEWNARMGIDVSYPDDHDLFLEHCKNEGQFRPTPLLLRYEKGDYNCLHQDLYGEQVFPLQVAFLLSEPGQDFDGGEFVLTEQRPRMQSRAEVVPLRRGDGVIFPVRQRPVRGARGNYRVNLRHGVSRILFGQRHTLGLIFHDAT